MSADRAPDALRVEGLCKHYGRTEVVRNLSLAVRPGERIALIGPNGAGKSTLFDLLSGRTPPSAGKILLHGRRIDGKRPFEINRLGLSRSFQVTNLFAQLSVFDNLRCALLWSFGYRYSLLKFLNRLTDANGRADALMAQIGLAAQRNVPAGHLAYAQQRALEIGVTVAGGASVILLDEPTSGMGGSEARRFVALIRQLTENRTLLVVEHDMGVAFDLASRVAVLARGELLAFDTPQAVRANRQVQEAYLGALGQAGAEQA